MGIIHTEIEHIPVTKLLTKGVVVLLVLMVAGFILTHYAQNFVFNNLAISVSGIMSGKIWQLVTYPFMERSTWNFLFSGWVVLLLGSNIERDWRTGAFLAMYLVLALVCGILWVLINAVLGKNFLGIGSAACAFGIIAAYGLLNRGKKLLFIFATVEAQFFAMLLIAIGIIINIPRPIGLIWLLSVPLAYFYVKLRLNKSRKRTYGGRQRRSGDLGGFVDID